MRKIPEIVYTTVRRVEPVGDDLVRLYCSLENGNAWEDRGTLLVPVNRLLKNAKFITESIADLYGETKVTSDLIHQLRLH